MLENENTKLESPRGIFATAESAAHLGAGWPMDCGPVTGAGGSRVSQGPAATIDTRGGSP